MEKLIKKYNEECDISSKLAIKIWEIGNIILLVIVFLCIIFKKILISFLTLLIGFSLLFVLCIYIDIKVIKKRLSLVNIALIASKNKKTAYQELDKFQKDWITNYCKTNKLNTINKLNIIREELKQRRENNTIKYLNPVIIGSLLIAVWEKGVEKLVNQIGFIYAILPLILLSIIISIIVTEILKQFKEQKDFINIFKDYSGYKRLEELLLYRILKTNK